jgi:hypothetical protein
MPLRTRIGFVVMWAASLVVVSMWGQAQTVENRLASPVILSGSDVGFRIEGRSGNTPIGRVVVRINGEWVVPESAGGLKPLTAK